VNPVMTSVIFMLQRSLSSMLARGRDDIEKAVEEGINHEEYLCILKLDQKLMQKN